MYKFFVGCCCAECVAGNIGDFGHQVSVPPLTYDLGCCFQCNGKYMETFTVEFHPGAKYNTTNEDDLHPCEAYDSFGCLDIAGGQTYTFRRQVRREVNFLGEVIGRESCLYFTDEYRTIDGTKYALGYARPAPHGSHFIIGIANQSVTGDCDGGFLGWAYDDVPESPYLDKGYVGINGGFPLTFAGCTDQEITFSVTPEINDDFSSLSNRDSGYVNCLSGVSITGATYANCETCAPCTECVQQCVNGVYQYTITQLAATITPPPTSETALEIIGLYYDGPDNYFIKQPGTTFTLISTPFKLYRNTQIVCDWEDPEPVYMGSFQIKIQCVANLGLHAFFINTSVAAELENLFSTDAIEVSYIDCSLDTTGCGSEFRLKFYLKAISPYCNASFPSDPTFQDIYYYIRHEITVQCATCSLAALCQQTEVGSSILIGNGSSCNALPLSFCMRELTTDDLTSTEPTVTFPISTTTRTGDLDILITGSGSSRIIQVDDAPTSEANYGPLLCDDDVPSTSTYPSIIYSDQSPSTKASFEVEFDPYLNFRLGVVAVSYTACDYVFGSPVTHDVKITAWTRNGLTASKDYTYSNVLSGSIVKAGYAAIAYPDSISKIKIEFHEHTQIAIGRINYCIQRLGYEEEETHL